MAGTIASSRFVGRTAELDRLEAAFAYARGGDLVTLCVGGEAGVGKTRGDRTMRRFCVPQDPISGRRPSYPRLAEIWRR